MKRYIFKTERETIILNKGESLMNVRHDEIFDCWYLMFQNTTIRCYGMGSSIDTSLKPDIYDVVSVEMLFTKDQIGNILDKFIKFCNGNIKPEDITVYLQYSEFNRKMISGGHTGKLTTYVDESVAECLYDFLEPVVGFNNRIHFYYGYLDLYPRSKEYREELKNILERRG